jgi:hypothetical protein
MAEEGILFLLSIVGTFKAGFIKFHYTTIAL